uniref:Uncharacterized protein n=1 Tax=Phlegmariurus squarrosus TaxID=73615 RepID=H9M851_PHLSQ|nr:hypothetical protein HusqMp57 [Phlegmariurus squarrosus]AEV55758.1 hypothetical protein HusqMp57 [Phlegmariurus squarrosus]
MRRFNERSLTGHLCTGHRNIRTTEMYNFSHHMCEKTDLYLCKACKKHGISELNTLFKGVQKARNERAKPAIIRKARGPAIASKRMLALKHYNLFWLNIEDRFFTYDTELQLPPPQSSSLNCGK